MASLRSAQIAARQRAILAQAPRPRSKYGAVKTTVDGIRFDSKKEAKRYKELRLLEKAGEVCRVELQPEFTLCAPDNHWDISVGHTGNPVVGKYRADFCYHTKGGQFVVEDVKGMRTPLYKWKKKHVEAQYGITIREI